MNKNQATDDELILGALWTIIQVIAGSKGIEMLEHLLDLKGFSKQEIGVITGEIIILQAQNYPHRSEFQKKDST